MTRHRFSRKHNGKTRASAPNTPRAAWIRNGGLLLGAMVAAGVIWVVVAGPLRRGGQPSQQTAELRHGGETPLASQQVPAKSAAPPSEPEAAMPEPEATPPEPDASPPEPRPAPPGPPGTEPAPAATAEAQDRALRKEQVDVARGMVETFPDSADALYLMAMVCREQGNVGQAVEYCQRALKLDSRRAEAHETIGYAALLKGDYPGAIASFRQALQINPRLPNVHFRMARALMRSGNIREAIAALQEDIKITPQASQSYRLLGEAYLQLKEYDNAKRYYRAATEIQPDLAEAYYGLATACARLREKDQARRYREKFNSLAADNQKGGRRWRSAFDPLAITRQSVSHTHTDVGRVYQRHGDLSSARRFWQRAAELDARNTVCRFQLASLYQRDNKLPKALELCEQIRDAEPANPVNYLRIGLLNQRLGRSDAAEVAYGKVVELAPQRSEGYRALAQLYLQTDQKPAEAATLAARAVELEPIAPNYLVLSQAHHRNGNRASALAAVKRAVTLDPDNEKYRRTHQAIQEGK